MGPNTNTCKSHMASNATRANTINRCHVITLKAGSHLMPIHTHTHIYTHTYHLVPHCATKITFCVLHCNDDTVCGNLWFFSIKRSIIHGSLLWWACETKKILAAMTHSSPAIKAISYQKWEKTWCSQACN